MSENDGITGDIRSREEEYFRRRDRELVEKLRQAAVSTEARQALEHSSGIHDPAMLQELEALGFTPDTVPLLPIVPIVQIAWAEGGVSGEERTLIVQFARERGIAADSVADRQLAQWLEQRPSEDVFARATRLIAAMLEHPPSEGQPMQADDLLRRCEEIAAASGGVLGFGKISAQERSLLARIQTALGNR